jgi:hypothetical protein
LHLLKGGELTVVQTGQGDLQFDEPTLLFFPRGRVHGFAVNPERGADLVCATVELGGAEGSPIGQGRPELVLFRSILSPRSEGSLDHPCCHLIVLAAMNTLLKRT